MYKYKSKLPHLSFPCLSIMQNVQRIDIMSWWLCCASCGCAQNSWLTGSLLREARRRRILSRSKCPTFSIWARGASFFTFYEESSAVMAMPVAHADVALEIKEALDAAAVHEHPSHPLAVVWSWTGEVVVQHVVPLTPTARGRWSSRNCRRCSGTRRPPPTRRPSSARGGRRSRRAGEGRARSSPVMKSTSPLEPVMFRHSRPPPSHISPLRRRLPGHCTQ